MCMKVGRPSGIVSGDAVMPLVTVNEDLQGCDTPTLLAHLAETLQLLHFGVFLDYHHTLL